MLECRRRQSEDVDEDRRIDGREKEADGIEGLSFSGDINGGKIGARSRSMGVVLEGAWTDIRLSGGPAAPDIEPRWLSVAERSAKCLDSCPPTKLGFLELGLARRVMGGDIAPDVLDIDPRPMTVATLGDEEIGGCRRFLIDDQLVGVVRPEECGDEEGKDAFLL